MEPPKSERQPGSELQQYVVKLVPELNATEERHSPLLALKEKVETYFKYVPDVAGFFAQELRGAITDGTYAKSGDSIEIKVAWFEWVDKFSEHGGATLWKSGNLSTTYILAIAAPAAHEAMYAALKRNLPHPKGTPTYQEIQQTPSASLSLAFRRAKMAALHHGKTTVMGVRLEDVHMFELLQLGKTGKYCSFSHIFTLAVGPEGFIIWQTWAEQNFPLDQYLKDGHGRVRNWKEAEQFIQDFEKLMALKGPWSAKANELYKKLFRADYLDACKCGPLGRTRSPTPKFKPWVHVLAMEDVTYEQVTKVSYVLERSG